MTATTMETRSVVSDHELATTRLIFGGQVFAAIAVAATMVFIGFTAPQQAYFAAALILVQPGMIGRRRHFRAIEASPGFRRRFIQAHRFLWRFYAAAAAALLFALVRAPWEVPDFTRGFAHALIFVQLITLAGFAVGFRDLARRVERGETMNRHGWVAPAGD